MCLCTTVAGKLRQWYNYDVWSNAAIGKKVATPITPQPPSATALADLVLVNMPPGCQLEIITV